ncbi:MAG: phosphopantetheine-binding protein [Planctomycetaceae bacterium]
MTHDPAERIHDLEQQILQIFADVIFIEVATPDVNLIDEGLLDSLVFVDLIMSLQERFQVELSIADLEFEQFQSVAHIARYMSQQLGANSAEVSSPTTGDVRREVAES